MTMSVSMSVAQSQSLTQSLSMALAMSVTVAVRRLSYRKGETPGDGGAELLGAPSAEGGPWGTGGVLFGGL